ncbi:hypothetical protein [Pseudomonas nitroreducens]
MKKPGHAPGFFMGEIWVTWREGKPIADKSAPTTAGDSGVLL